MAGSDDIGSVSSSVYRANLPAPPSCIEFSPRLKHVFIVGTYSLNENESQSSNSDITLECAADGSQLRSGILLLFHLSANHDSANIKESYTTKSAVLDIHFSPHDLDLLATATSTGVILLDRLNASGERLQRCKIIQAFDPSKLVLSLAWNPDSRAKEELAVTLSSGKVAIVDTQAPCTNHQASRLYEAHPLEAWTIAWSQGAQFVYSGGDDSVIRMWNPHTAADDQGEEETRLPADDEFEKYLLKGPPVISIPGTMTDARSHTAGVTAVLPLLVDGDLDVLATGSYDEMLRIMIPRQGRTWTLVAELPLGGGVWRLKLLRTYTDGDIFKATVLASCMHAGPKVVEIKKIAGAWSVELTTCLQEHESMNYGSDAVPGPDQDQYTIVSTSFYDRLLCIWRSP